MKVTKKIFPLLLLSIAVSCCEKGVLDANQDGSGEGVIIRILSADG